MRLSEEDALAIGRVVGGRFTVDGVLGVGGMGYVYSAHDAEKRSVALKVLHPELLTNKVAVSRFMTEAETIFKLRHPNIVEVFDYGRDNDDTLFIAMEMLGGQTVVDAIQKRGALPVNESQFIATETARALAAAHSAGVVHRDLKPENIMLVPKDGGGYVVKVLDFGLAVVMEDNRIQMQRQRLTQADVVMGTPGYMSPEQIHGFDVDGRADLYSLGVIWWEMLTGRQLFSGRSSVEVMMRHIEERPPHPERVNPLAKLSVPAAQLLASLLEKKKSDRPQDGNMVLQYLEQMARADEPPRSVTPVSVDISNIDLSTPNERADVDLEPTGLELDTDLPSTSGANNLDAMAASLRGAAHETRPPSNVSAPTRPKASTGSHSSTGSHIADAPGDLWMVERDGVRQTDITRNRLKAMAKSGKIRAQDKVARHGKPFAAAGSFTFLELVPPTQTPRTGEIRGPQGMRATSYRGIVIGAVCVALGGGAAYVYTQRPDLLERAQAAVMGIMPSGAASPTWSQDVQRRLEAAAKKAKVALPRAPLTVPQEAAALAKAEALVRRGRTSDRKKADATLLQAMLATPNDPRTVSLFIQNRSEMRSALRKLRAVDELRLIDEMQARTGDNPSFALARAAVALAKGRADDALVAARNTTSADGLRFVALAHLAQGNAKAALDTLQKASALAPRHAGLYLPTAHAALLIGDAPKARTSLDARLKVAPTDGKAHVLDAQYWVYASDTGRAVRALRRLRAKNADVSTKELLNGAYLALNEIGQPELALALLRSAPQSTPLTAKQIESGAIRSVLEGTKTAATQLSTLKAASLSHPTPHLMDAEIAMRRSDGRRAAVSAQQAISGGADKRFPLGAYLLLGEALLDDKKSEAAADSFRWAASIDSEASWPHVGLILASGLNENVRLELLARGPLLGGERAAPPRAPPLQSAERLSTRLKSIRDPFAREFASALVSLQRRDYSTATTKFFRLLAKNRGDALVRTYYAAALVGRGHHARAITALAALPADKQQTIAGLMLSARALAGADQADARNAIASADAAVKKSSMRSERKVVLGARLETLRAQIATRDGVDAAATLRYRAAYQADSRSLPARQYLFQQ